MTDEHLTPLPLPDSHAAPEDRAARGERWSFGEQVDTYCADHGVSRAECFRRIAAITGSAINGLNLRYRQRGGDAWLFVGR